MMPKNTIRRRQQAATTGKESSLCKGMRFLLLCCVVVGGALVLQRADVHASQLFHQLFPEEKDDFEYVLKDRHDPFKSFISEELLEQDAVAETEVLTGLRRFEPGQLSLVAIVFSDEKEPVAMVEDSSGKGYVIKKGEKIGRTGVVSEIVENEVRITTTITTWTGEAQHSLVKMELKKEGEKWQ